MFVYHVCISCIDYAGLRCRSLCTTRKCLNLWSACVAMWFARMCCTFCSTSCTSVYTNCVAACMIYVSCHFMICVDSLGVRSMKFVFVVGRLSDCLSICLSFLQPKSSSNMQGMFKACAVRALTKVLISHPTISTMKQLQQKHPSSAFNMKLSGSLFHHSCLNLCLQTKWMC